MTGEAWTDRMADYPPLPRNYEKCPRCGDDLALRHVCAQPLGYVVLARRPNQPAEPVSAVFPAYPKGLEQAQNVLESCEDRNARLARLLTDPPAGAADVNPAHMPELDPVEYVIGQISEWSGA